MSLHRPMYVQAYRDIFQAPVPIYLGRTEFRINALEVGVGSFFVFVVELNGWGPNLNTF